MKYLFLPIIFIAIANGAFAQGISKTMLRLPDTGETMSYTNTFGEDHDYTINPPFFIVHGDGTVTDTVTGLMWQQTDGGEMTIENARLYVDSLTLGGYTDWRLPAATEGFSILNHQHVNPALDGSVFTDTGAEYWWCSEHQANDTTKIWGTNAGGGIGSHPKSETISAGGNKSFHARAVRNISTPPVVPAHFTNNGDGTILDNLTGLMWQQLSAGDSLTWENALQYADTLTLGGYTDWRLPNIKELQSIEDVTMINPAVNPAFFTNIFSGGGAKKYWSSTTLPNIVAKAWYLDAGPGLTTYEFKTARLRTLFVRGSSDAVTAVPEIVQNGRLLTAFPNPFTTNIRLKGQAEGDRFELINCFGQVVYAGPDIEAQDFAYLSAGIYFLKTTGQSASLLKLIKE